jgi:hypothetical protein
LQGQISGKERLLRQDVSEAFDNFKVSTELEQTKRLRQIGDMIANQQRIMGQYSYNEKSYRIFQTTSQRICDQMANIVELIGLQNSLNFQEEKDKHSIALVSGLPSDKAGADPGSQDDRAARAFMADKLGALSH